METIPKNKCIKIGFIRKTHGVMGEVILEFDARFEESVAENNRFFIELDGLLVPFFLEEEGFRFKTSHTAILNFKWAETENYARRLVGCNVYLFDNEIIDEEIETIQSWLLNYTLLDEKTGIIGQIIHVDDFSGNIVLTVTYKNDELLVPFNEDFLVSYDEIKKTITLRLPDGLIET